MNEPSFEPAEEEALLFLRAQGFDVKPVPRSRELTPEFEAELAGERYLFEVKARRDDEALDEIEPGEVLSQSQHLFWSQGILKNVRKAVRQLRQHDPQHHRYWIVWLRAEAPIAGDAAEEQIRGTLLGSCAVVDLATATEAGVSEKDCFYAQKGAFEQFPELDAAVIATTGGYQMWVNEFGRPDQIIQSRLGRVFAGRGLNIPKEHDEAGRAYRMATTGGERSEGVVQAYLRATYGLKMPILLRFQSHRALSMLPLENNIADDRRAAHGGNP